MIDNKSRITAIGIVFLLLCTAVVMRLGYLQIVKHDYFSVLANQSHFRKFEIIPQRGNIFMQDRGELVPVAMNQNQKTLYADTRYIFDEARVVSKLKNILGNDYSDKINNEQGYVVLEEVVDQAAAKEIEELRLSGIGLSDNYKRVYPEGTMGSHLLGFVNHDKDGQYGIEGFHNLLLKGRAGMFDAETDARGIPIATSDNILVAAEDGADIVLTIDRNIQAQAESILEQNVKSMNAKSAHAVIMDPGSGAILAMANYPTFDPNEYTKVDDYRRFINTTVSEQFEPGSGFKMFTMAAGLEEQVVKPNQTFYDEGSVRVADHTIKNPIGGVGPRTMTDVIVDSLNTGVVHVLKQLGGGNLNDEAKEALYDYFVNKFELTVPTGIEQPNEPTLQMNKPKETGPVNYANMSFGQGITTTMIRMVASMSAVINDGVMYKPYMVDHHILPSGDIKHTEPSVVRTDVVSAQTSKDIREMMHEVVERGGGYGTKIEGYKIGGKTGTAQIPSPDGGYYSDRDIGTFIGFAPLDQPRYIMMVRIDEPRVAGYSGSGAAGPVFGDIMEWLLNYGGIPTEEG